MLLKTLVIASCCSLATFGVASSEVLAVSFLDFGQGTICSSSEPNADVEMVEKTDSFGIVLDGANLRELELTCTLTDGRSFIFPAGDYSDSQAESINILVRPDGTGEVYRTGMHETGQMVTMLTHTLKDALRWIM